MLAPAAADDDDLDAPVTVAVLHPCLVTAHAAVVAAAAAAVLVTPALDSACLVTAHAAVLAATVAAAVAAVAAVLAAVAAVAVAAAALAAAGRLPYETADQPHGACHRSTPPLQGMQARMQAPL